MIGFTNLGNTCYCSAVLQCFIYNPGFIEIIENNQNNQNNNNELMILLNDILNSKNKEYSLLPLLKLINKQKPWFEPLEQNDAHEFLLLFLDVLLNDTTKEYSRKTFLKNNNNLLVKSYYGELKSVVTCDQCKKSNKSFVPFNSINLNIPSEKREYPLSELFHLFFLENNIDFKCEECKNERNIKKKEYINILPNNLIIVLNRYSSNGVKNNTQIQIPLILSITEKKTGDIKDYSLTGIINHFGILLSGHYNNIIINNNDYYLIDDTFITKINNNNNNHINSKNCYILFYSDNKE